MRGLSGRRVALIAGVLVVVVVAGVAIAVGSAFLSSSNPPIPHFVAEGAASGIDHVYSGDFDYYVGGGVAAFDCNGDGRPELYFAGGSGPAALYLNESAVGGALRFTAKPDPQTDLDAVTGAYPIDIDGDGITDLAVLRVGGNVLLRGLGDCRFEDANEAVGVRRRRRLVDGVLGHVGAGRELADARDRELPGPVPAARLRAAICFDNALYRPGARCRRVRGADTTHAGLVRAVDAVLRAGTAPVEPISASATTGTTTPRTPAARNSCGESQPGRHRASTRRPTAGSHCEIWGMGIGSYDVNGDGYPDYLPDQPGRQQAPGPGKPGNGITDLPRHRAVDGRHGHSTVRR